MSWDVMIFNLGGNAALTLDEWNDNDLLPLGPATTVRQRISTLLVGTDWTDPTWGLYEEDALSIEFNVGKNDPIDNMMLHVRGSGSAIEAIARFAKPLGWSAFDCSTGEFLDLDAPSRAGWEGFQAYRDKVLDHLQGEGTGQP